ncbi:MAG: DnaB-like helicase C-terminal domain-containing protein [Nitrospira sp.]
MEGKQDFRFLALNPQTLRLESAPVSQAFGTGLKPVYKMVTCLGRSIRATANHRFLTMVGWKRLDELKASDYIALPSSNLTSLIDSEISWDGILSIIPDGEEAVFDLTFPDHHNFVANNIVVHNSLEQDADIVMFIYRDDKDPAMQNVSHLKVAKHRNGPVGTVDLIFRSNLTKFENATTRRLDLSQA